jgi:hypothetical protein
LRFAVHGPGNPVASPRSHGVPRRDVPGRIHIGITCKPTVSADEDRLALARLRIHMPAGRATLARISGSNAFNPPGSLVIQSLNKHAPGRAEDAPVQARFSLHVLTRRLHSPFSRSSHVFDLEILGSDYVELPRQASTGLLCPIFASIGLTGLQFRDRLLYPGPAIGPSPRSGEFALQPDQMPSLVRGKAGHVKQFSGGQSSRHQHPPVDADDLTIAWRWYRDRHRHERDVPASCPIAGHSMRLHSIWHITGPPEPHPARLRDAHKADVSVQTAHIAGLYPNDPESFVPPSFPPRRPPARPVEEARHRLREVPQCLLLNHIRASAEPWMLRPNLSELPGLLQVARRAPSARSPVRMLLNRQVPHIPGVRTVFKHY